MLATKSARLFRAFVRCAFLTLSVGSCASVTQPPAEPLASRIYSMQDTVPLVRRGAEFASLDFNAVVKNNDRRVLFVGGCMSPAQREIDHVWYTVFWSQCVGTGNYTRVNPGDSTILYIRERGYNYPGFENTLSPRLGPGRYRLLVEIGYGDESGEMVSNSPGSKISEPFVVRDST
jgi:hypothetical protein